MFKCLPFTSIKLNSFYLTSGLFILNIFISVHLGSLQFKVLHFSQFQFNSVNVQFSTYQLRSSGLSYAKVRAICVPLYSFQLNLRHIKSFQFRRVNVHMCSFQFRLVLLSEFSVYCSKCSFHFIQCSVQREFIRAKYLVSVSSVERMFNPLKV